MDGEFTCEETFGTVKGVAGGNIILLGTEPAATLAATEAAVAAMRTVPRRDPAVPRRDRPVGLEGRQQVQGAAGQHQHGLRADACAGWSRPSCPHEVRCVYEIVIDGLTLEAVERATAVGLVAAARPDRGVVAITAGNYGGKLGPFHIRLREVAGRTSTPEKRQ